MAEKETKDAPAAPTKAPKFNYILELVNNPRVQRISGYVVAIVVFAYLLIAILSFVGVVPKSIAKNLPLISGVVNRAQELEELTQAQSMDAYHLNTKIVYPKFSRAYRKDDPYSTNDPSVNALIRPPDQVVMKRQFVNGKNVGEIFLNDQLVIRIAYKADFVNEFARADAMTEQLKILLDRKADLAKLEPKIVSGNMALALESAVVGNVYAQDAIVNNSTPMQQALAWINNIRIAMGINKPLTLDDFAGVEAPATANVKPVQAEVEAEPVVPTKEVQAPVDNKVQADKERQKLMKKVVNVYNTMPSGQALDIFNKMTDTQAVEILAQMKNRQLSKILAIMEPSRAARITEMIADKKAENKK